MSPPLFIAKHGHFPFMFRGFQKTNVTMLSFIVMLRLDPSSPLLRGNYIIFRHRYGDDYVKMKQLSCATETLLRLESDTFNVYPLHFYAERRVQTLTSCWR